jgi:hypothetical protein
MRVLAARLERAGEQVREFAARELCTYLGAVRRFLQQVGVGVVCLAGAGVADAVIDR